VWSPSFECFVRPNGEHAGRIGHRQVDEFLEFVVGRVRANTVRRLRARCCRADLVQRQPTRGQRISCGAQLMTKVPRVP
jgi:hypothetical protein